MNQRSFGLFILLCLTLSGLAGCTIGGQGNNPVTPPPEKEYVKLSINWDEPVRAIRERYRK